MRIAIALAVCSLSAPAFAGNLTSIPHPQPRSSGLAAPNVLSPELFETPVAQGSEALENPTDRIGYYGYLYGSTAGAVLPMLPAPGAKPGAGNPVEAQKTEPDKNLYLVLQHQKGPDGGYDYGRHFLFQGHEAGLGHFTRVNLDADADHRVTLMASADVNGEALPTYDGITWDPFARRILLTAEGGAQGGLWQATLEYPSQVEYLVGSTGSGGDEGVQVDDQGNLWIVEDAGGATGKVNSHARQPNSFVYRFVPFRSWDLTRGRMQVLQVLDAGGNAFVFHDGDADGDIKGKAMEALHTYGKSFDFRWVTIHDTSVDGTAAFNANALAKLRGGTPFKRPENGVFRPGSGFRQFIFTETGDTSALSEAGSQYGGFGALFLLTVDRCDGDEGKITLFYNGDLAHTGLDNIAWWSPDEVVAVEDAGDTLHGQRMGLDSAFLFRVNGKYAKGEQPLRLLAEGRDAAATLDAAFSGMAGHNNDGDNEITGFHVSDGDPTIDGLLGAREFRPFQDGWRVFWTQQHGDNVTWEILPDAGKRRHDD